MNAAVVALLLLLNASLALAAEPAATITDRSRNVEQTDDFLRIIFLPPGSASP